MSFDKILPPGEVITFFTNIAILLAGIIYCTLRVKKYLKEFKEDNDNEKVSDMLKVSRSVKKQSEIDLEIYRELERAKEITNADAINVFEFHNGGHYANGRNALKTTCSFEVVRSGIRTHQRDLVAIPLSVFPISIKELLENDKLVIKDVKSFTDTHPSLGCFLNQFQIKSAYIKVLKNDYGDPVGAVVVSYVNNDYDIRADEIDRLIWFIEDKLISSLNK